MCFLKLARNRAFSIILKKSSDLNMCGFENKIVLPTIQLSRVFTRYFGSNGTRNFSSRDVQILNLLNFTHLEPWCATGGPCRLRPCGLRCSVCCIPCTRRTPRAHAAASNQTRTTLKPKQRRYGTGWRPHSQVCPPAMSPAFLLLPRSLARPLPRHAPACVLCLMQQPRART